MYVCCLRCSDAAAYDSTVTSTISVMITAVAIDCRHGLSNDLFALSISLYCWSYIAYAT